MSADTTKQIQATPPAERGQMFEMIKMMGALTNVKITKETRTATGATLTVTALDSDKKNTTGTIDIVKENSAWKLGRKAGRQVSRLVVRGHEKGRVIGALSRSFSKPGVEGRQIAIGCSHLFVGGARCLITVGVSCGTSC